MTDVPDSVLDALLDEVVAYWEALREAKKDSVETVIERFGMSAITLQVLCGLLAENVTVDRDLTQEQKDSLLVGKGLVAGLVFSQVKRDD